IGVSLHEEAGGKLFPDTNRARDVLAALLAEADRVGVTLIADRRVLDVVKDGDEFRVITGSHELTASAVVLASGGCSLPKSGSDGAGFEIARRLGHTIVPTTPALVPLLLANDQPHRQLQGVSQDVELTIWIDRRAAWRLRGSLLWTHFGISGPAVLNASRH